VYETGCRGDRRMSGSLAEREVLLLVQAELHQRRKVKPQRAADQGSAARGRD
jgi:hypothetical protein